jgi:hypothetical protein
MQDKINVSKILDTPYKHIIIDNFLPKNLAEIISDQFPQDGCYDYNNPVEIKETCNHWDKFPKETYQLFWDLCSSSFTSSLSEKFNMNLFADIGLNGGGWHIHKKGGKLNIHLDYSLHPKVNYERKINLILYLNKNWVPSWGGGLELWSHNEIDNQPKELIKTIDTKFNRAIIFDTSDNSWHGISGTINCPENEIRKSIAVYYITPATEKTNKRSRALFSPDDSQKSNNDILEFIKKRST